VCLPNAFYRKQFCLDLLSYPELTYDDVVVNWRDRSVQQLPLAPDRHPPKRRAIYNVIHHRPALILLTLDMQLEVNGLVISLLVLLVGILEQSRVCLNWDKP
jgi:hypothetical protein